MQLFIISGLSGAGKSVALHAIEDRGGHCIDNLPIELLPNFVEEILPALQQRFSHVGLSIDARNSSERLQQLPQHLNRLFPKSGPIHYTLIFIEASPQTLTRRYGESRRPHPLSHDGLPLQQAIEAEIRQLAPIAAAAEFHLDSSQSSIYQLREQINAISDQSHPQLFLKLQSFGYKYGVPRDADFLFDARCLPNPYWEADLRPLNGKEPPIATYLERSATTQEVREEIYHYITRSVPRFLCSDRSYLTIGIGCTGGHHRSVYLVEQIGKELHNLQDSAGKNSENSWIRQCRINIHHRELSSTDKDRVKP